MPDTFTFEEAQAPEADSFTFEEATGDSFSFEEAQADTPGPIGGLDDDIRGALTRGRTNPVVDARNPTGPAGFDEDIAGAGYSIQRGLKGMSALMPNLVLPEVTRNLEREQRTAAIGLPTDSIRSTLQGGRMNPAIESRKLSRQPPEERAGRVAQAQSIRDVWAGVAAEFQQEIAGIPRSQAQAELAAARNAGDKWGVFRKYPVQTVSSIVLESLPPSIAGAVLGTAAGGPGVGTAAGVGLASAAQEFSGEFLKGAVDAGFDPTDEVQLATFLDSPAFEPAFSKALTRASVVGGVDTATAGQAGRFIGPALKTGLGNVLKASGKEIGLQAAGGAGGEFLAQTATKGDESYDWFDIAMEAAAEIATGPAEAFSNVRQEGINRRGAETQRSPESGAVPSSAPQRLSGEPEADTSPDALAELQAVLRGEAPGSQRLKGALPRQEPVKADVVESVMADLPQSAQAQLTRRMQEGPAVPEGLPAPEKREPGSTTVDFVPTEEIRAAMEFQKKTDEAVKAALENPDKNYEGMSRLELELLEGMGDARATAALRRMRARAQIPNSEFRIPNSEQASPPVEFVPSSEPPAPAETITGSLGDVSKPSPSNERTGSEMPAEANQPVPPSLAASPSPKPSRPKHSIGERPWDVIDEIEAEVGGKIDPALIRAANPNWKPVGAARKLFRKGGRGADVVLNAITYGGPKLGLQQDTGMQEFGDALNHAATARQGWKGQAKRERTLLDEQAREAQTRRQFENKALAGERPKSFKEGVQRVPVDDLVEGDKFQVQDVNFTVEAMEFDPEDDGRVLSVTVKDGPKFGTQTIEGGSQVIHIDEGTMRRNRKGRAAAGEFQPQEQKATKETKDAVESTLDKLKIDISPDQLHAFGLIPQVWNGLIETVRLAYRGGKTIAAAIEDGLAWLKATHGEQQFDEAAVRAELRKVVAGPEARPEDTPDSQLENLQQRLESLELNIIRTRRTGNAQRTRALLDERERIQAEFNRLRYGTEQAAAQVEQGGTSAPIEEFTQAQLDKVSSATMDGAPSAETFWQRLKRGLRYFATNTPEIALTGDEAQNAAMFRRGVRLFGVESENAKRTAARKINAVIEPLRALGRKVTNPDEVAKFFDLGNRIRREEQRANPNEDRLAKWRAMQTDVRTKLEGNPWYLFQQAVLWRDLWYRARFLKTPSGGDITLPGGLEIDQVERAMQRNDQLIASNPNQAAIRESLQKHYALMAELQESLLQHGELIPDELRNPLYFPHHLLEKFTGQLDRARPTTEKDFRGYLIAPTGSEKLIEAGYLNALYKHVNDVTAHNARADVVEKYWRPYDKAAERQAELEAEATENDTTAHPEAWKRNIPPGMELFTPSEEIPMRADYILNRAELGRALGVALAGNGDLRAQLQALGAEVRLTGDMITKALVAGDRPQWLLPSEIAEAIRGVVKREEAKSAVGVGKTLGKFFAKPIQMWKANTLFNWYNYPRYEWGNTITDVIDKMLGADPGMARYLGRSLKEVWAATKGERTDEYEAAEREGVLQTVTAQEVADLAKLPEFEEFLSSKQWKLEKVRKFITWTARASALRESTFRYAKFLADLERIRRGEQPVYAGAYWRDVQAAPTPEAKAAEIALKTFGDYGNMSVVGEFLRKHVIPFWSWQEINLKYHANLFRNLRDMIHLPVEERPVSVRDAGRAAAVATATFTARAAVGIALRLAVMRLAVEMWNQFGGAWAGLWDPDDDLESQLSEADRRRMHLILGKDENGRVRVVYVPNAISDVAEWFGGNNFARLFTEWVKGDISLGQFVGDYAKQLPTDLANKVVQGARPDAKFAYMAVSGKDPFPDVTAQRDISRENLGWMLMQTVTDRDAATFLRQQLDKDFYAPETMGDWLGRKLLQIRRRDPEQWAYYEVRDKAADWKEAKTGKRNEGFDYRSPDQQVIRNFRKAIYRGDMPSAIRFYNRLRDYGYTKERFAASIRNSDPLSDLNRFEQRDFKASLTPYEAEMLARAQKYYARLSASRGREGALFPSNPRDTRRPGERRVRELLTNQR